MIFYLMKFKVDKIFCEKTEDEKVGTMITVHSPLLTIKGSTMKRILCAFMMSSFILAQGQEKFQLEKSLPKELKEISGTVRDGDVLWAITDANGSLYKLDLGGQVLQQLKL